MLPYTNRNGVKSTTYCKLGGVGLLPGLLFDLNIGEIDRDRDRERDRERDFEREGDLERERGDLERERDLDVRKRIIKIYLLSWCCHATLLPISDNSFLDWLGAWKEMRGLF